MSFVVLAPGASALACSIVHSHQDSFGHELDLAAPPNALPVLCARRELPVSCTCGWTGILPRDDVLTRLDGVAR